MASTPDYRDALQILFNELRRDKGLTLFRIAKLTAMNEQNLAAVLRRERNLSMESLEGLIDSLGYRISFEQIPAEENMAELTYRASSQ